MVASVSLQTDIISVRLQSCLSFLNIKKQGVGSKLLQLAKDNTPTMLYFGAQPGIEKFYEKNGCKRSLQSYVIEKERS